MNPFFSVHQAPPYTVVEFETESLTHAPDLERIGQGLYEIVDRPIPQGGAVHLLLDCTKVRYLSSQAIGIILTLNKKLSRVPGSTLTLCGVGPQLLQLLKITRLDKLLKIQPTQADALSSVRS